MNIRLIIISAVLFLIIIVSEYIAYASLHYAQIIKSAGLEISLMVLGVFLPVVFIISMLYGYKHYSLLNSWLNEISSIWIGIVIYILIASLIIFLLIMSNIYLGTNIPLKLVSLILMFVVLLLVGYGIWNASNPRIVQMDITSENLSNNWKGKKIVIISDIHLGMQKRVNYLKKIIAKINTENPDVVFILGDLIDGPAFPYKEWLGEFDNLKPQIGNIYIEGNHEKYSQEYEEFKSNIPESITNLTDKKIIINNTQIIGLDYIQDESVNETKSRLENLQYDKDQPSIVLLHDPKNIKALSEKGVSLVLSGHTHGGQFFPFTMLIKLIYRNYSHGIVYTDKTASVTSYGVGTAVIPMRIETVPEIIVLNIK